MSDPGLRPIEQRIADILEELRIMRAQHDTRFGELRETSDRMYEAGERRFAALRDELRDLREASAARHREEVEELRALRATSDLQTKELRKASATNAIQTDALRVVLDRILGTDPPAADAAWRAVRSRAPSRRTSDAHPGAHAVRGRMPTMHTEPHPTGWSARAERTHHQRRSAPRGPPVTPGP